MKAVSEELFNEVDNQRKEAERTVRDLQRQLDDTVSSQTLRAILRESDRRKERQDIYGRALGLIANSYPPDATIESLRHIAIAALKAGAQESAHN